VSMPVARSPYVGLTPFDKEDETLFFGRDRERRLLTHAVLAEKLTLVYGPSGVGKSSLLLAGVVPDLRARGQRRLTDQGHPEVVPVVFRSWRDGVAELRRAVAAAFGDGADRASGSLADVVEAVTEATQTRVVVVLDQLEDYFVYHEGADGDTFADELEECLGRRRLRASFLLSIREDALGRLDRFTERIPQLFEHTIRVENLSREDAWRAIKGPLASLGADVEDELVEAVIDQTAAGRIVIGAGGLESTVGDAGVEPAYLQLVMARLWEDAMSMGTSVLRRELLDRLGGAERIVRAHLDSALEELPGEELALAAGLFRYLVTPSGTAIAHTAVDLASFVDRPRADVERVLARLEQARILRAVAPSDASAQIRHEIFHGALAPPLLEWLRRFELEEARRSRRGRAGVRLLVGALIVVVIAESVLLLVTR
jgi:hypothetical protein